MARSSLPEENCSFVAYSESALKKHVVFHSQPPTLHRDYPCSMANCKASFPGKHGLQRHLNVHNNIQLSCIFCPFTTGEPDKLLIHQRSHFNIRDYQCEICEATFKTRNSLNIHYNGVHSNVTTKCFVCDYEATIRNVQSHLKLKHKIQGYRWDEENAEFVKMQF